MLRVLALVGLFSFVGFADEAPKSTEPASPWTSTAEASVLLTSGNTQFTTLGGAIESNYKAEPWEAKGKISYLQNSQAGVTKAELFTVDGRADHVVSGNLAAYIQGGFLRNTFAGFNSRTLIDAGLKYSLIKNPAHVLSTELGIGTVAEDRTDIGGNSFAIVKGTIDYTWKISPTTDFGTQLTVLENLKTTNDLRVSSVTSLTLVMTSTLSTKVGFRVDFLNSPVAGKVATDTATTLALVAKF
jgi:putative salt-induced outer membrane protein